MSELTLSSFYPNKIIFCDSDLNFEDGIYKVWEREVILNIFIIEKSRIQYHIQYNTSLKKRLITWKFEYLTAEDGTQIHNVWILTDRNKYDLYTSSHWNLYPEEYNIRAKHDLHFNAIWDKFIDHLRTCPK